MDQLHYVSSKWTPLFMSPTNVLGILFVLHSIGIVRTLTHPTNLLTAVKLGRLPKGIMGRFGSQTSTYNRLVAIFVAIGSMVSSCTFLHSFHGTNMLDLHRHMDIARRLFLVRSASRDGIPTSTSQLMENRDTPRSRLPQSQPLMVSSVPAAQLVHSL